MWLLPTCSVSACCHCHWSKSSVGSMVFLHSSWKGQQQWSGQTPCQRLVKTSKRIWTPLVHPIRATNLDRWKATPERHRNACIHQVTLSYIPSSFIQVSDTFFLHLYISISLFRLVAAYRALCRFAKNNYTGHLAKLSSHPPDSYCLATIHILFFPCSESLPQHRCHSITSPPSSAFVFTGFLAAGRNNQSPGQNSAHQAGGPYGHWWEDVLCCLGPSTCEKTCNTAQENTSCQDEVPSLSDTIFPHST